MEEPTTNTPCAARVLLTLTADERNMLALLELTSNPSVACENDHHVLHMVLRT